MRSGGAARERGLLVRRSRVGEVSQVENLCLCEPRAGGEVAVAVTIVSMLTRWRHSASSPSPPC